MLARLKPDYVMISDNQEYLGGGCIAKAPALKTDYEALASIRRQFGDYVEHYIVHRRR